MTGARLSMKHVELTCDRKGLYAAHALAPRGEDRDAEAIETYGVTVGDAKRLIAGADSLRDRGPVLWNVDITGVSNGADGSESIHYWVHAESNEGYKSRRAYRFTGALTVTRNPADRVTVASEDDDDMPPEFQTRAIVISRTEFEGTIYTGGVVGVLLADAFDRGALRRFGIATLPGIPLGSPLADDVPLAEDEWLQQIAESRR